MKHTQLIFNYQRKFVVIFLFSTFSFSCNQEVVLQEKNEKTSSSAILNEGVIAYPKKRVLRSKSLEQNWDDWTKVKLASGDSVYVPWNNQYVATTIPIDIRQDVKSSKGWELIAHTVNGYGERGMNYLIFHNRYTGILKVFYYLESTQSALQNTAIWKLHFEVPQSCLAFSETYANVSTKKNLADIYLGNITNDDSKGYTIGWNCFQTELAYDPDLTMGTLQIIPSSMTTSNIQVSGNMEAQTEGLIISATSSNVMDGTVKSAASFAGKKAEDWVEKSVTNGAFKQISSLIIKGAGSLVSSGISSLLGTFIGGFNKEQQTTQTVQLRTNGTVTLEGNIKTLQSGIITPLSLSISPQDIGRLGVWCLTKKPILRLDPYARHVRQDAVDPSSQLYGMSSPELYLELEDRYVINPELLSYIDDYKIKGKVFWKGGEILLRDALKQGKNSSYCHTQSPVFSKDCVYDNVYLPYLEVWAEIKFKDKNGMIVEDFEAYAPFEIYVPNNSKGEPGANPYFTFNSSYILSVSMELVTEQDGEKNTIVSNHTFIPDIEWDKDRYGDLYYSTYPFIPIDWDNISIY